MNVNMDATEARDGDEDKVFVNLTNKEVTLLCIKAWQQWVL
jgi:hypothetical protein